MDTTTTNLPDLPVVPPGPGQGASRATGDHTGPCRCPGPIHQPDAHRDTDILTRVAEAGVRALIALTGENPDRAGLVDTPARVVRAVLDMTDRPGDPGDLLARTFGDAGPVDEMITLGPVEFTSLCEHHMLPFTGHAWVSYVPHNGVIVGLSKLARLVEHHAHRLQVQERMTNSIADDLMRHLTPRGCGVRVTATHSCMAVRGVRKPGARMTTTALRGVFFDQPETRAEFLAATA